MGTVERDQSERREVEAPHANHRVEGGVRAAGAGQRFTHASHEFGAGIVKNQADGVDAHDRDRFTGVEPHQQSRSSPVAAT
ncbi:MAG: hypothetical protein IT194_10825 [Microthrixaceae bacterium]|nr:hypothetical protein [Microthrixaceae bacterium]